MHGESKDSDAGAGADPRSCADADLCEVFGVPGRVDAGADSEGDGERDGGGDGPAAVAVFGVAMCSGSSGATKGLSGLMKPIGVQEMPGTPGVFEEGYRKTGASMYPSAFSMQAWMAEQAKRKLVWSDTQGRML